MTYQVSKFFLTVSRDWPWLHPLLSNWIASGNPLSSSSTLPTTDLWLASCSVSRAHAAEIMSDYQSRQMHGPTFCCSWSCTGMMSYHGYVRTVCVLLRVIWCRYAWLYVLQFIPLRVCVDMCVMGPPGKQDDPIQVGVPDALKLKGHVCTSGTQIASQQWVVWEQWCHLIIRFTVKH